MATTGLQLLGLSLCVIGWVGAIATCALPMWRVTAFIGNNIVVAQTIWEGLWMNCIVQSTGQMQCKVYDSMLALPRDLQAARALTVIGILLALLALLVSVAGAKCTNCVQDEDFYNPLVSESQKRELGGSVFIGWGSAALLILGGCFLCCACPVMTDQQYGARYKAGLSRPRSEYPSTNYV
ncbi:CLD4 protein, partial [Polyodon spathula]|nr:CLD4 protein [Polyodon spathula]